VSSPAASHLTLLHPAAPHHASPHHASPHRAVPHIVILNDFGHINGGAGKVALDSAAALGRRGYRVTLLCAVLPVDPGLLRDNVRVECTEQFEIRADPDRLRAARQGIWNRKAVRALSAVLDGCDRANTIVHAHGWTKALSPACLHTALKRDFKVVVTLHEYFLACPNGGFFDYREQRICRRRPLSLGCMAANCDSTSYAEKLWRIGRQMVQRDFIRAPRDIRHFITVSAFSRDVIGAFLPQTSAIYPVPNPIDAGREPPIDVAANRGMLYVGRMAQEKGVMTLARAAQGAGLPVAYVGDGICRESVNRINPRAICTGWVDGEEVKRHMRLARALIFPSEWYETWWCLKRRPWAFPPLSPMPARLGRWWLTESRGCGSERAMSATWPPRWPCLKTQNSSSVWESLLSSAIGNSLSPWNGIWRLSNNATKGSCPVEPCSKQRSKWDSKSRRTSRRRASAHAG